MLAQGVRRTVTAEGRSRAWVNDESVAVSELKELGRRLVDIHGPRANQNILEENFQRTTLDRFGGIELSKYSAAYGELQRVENNAVKKATDEEAAFYYKDSVIPKMEALRRTVDAMEVLTAREAWPVPTYGDITFRI